MPAIEPGKTCQLVSAHYRELSAVIPRPIYVCGERIACENTFLVDFDLPPEFYREHVRRLITCEHLLGTQPGVLWLCFGSSEYYRLTYEAKFRGWQLRYANIEEFDQWLKMSMQCLAHLLVHDGLCAQEVCSRTLP